MLNGLTKVPKMREYRFIQEYCRKMQQKLEEEERV